MAAKLRCLVITELFLPTKGGTAVWFAEVYARLGGREIHILTADVPDAAEVDREHPNSVHRIKLRRHAWLKPESLLMYLKLFGFAIDIAIRHRTDGVHAGRVLPEGLVAWAVACLTRKPFIVYAHGEELTTWGRGLKYRTMVFTFQRADLVIANSEYTRGELLKIGVDANRIALIYPGVDTTRFRPGLPCDDLRNGLGLGLGQKLVLSVGRLQRRKGFDSIVRSIPLLVANNVDMHYAAIGIGEDRNYLENLARELGVAERVHFVGRVAQTELPRWYNACDLFAMPNRDVDGDTEGFGIVYIEAGACGKPVIAGNAGGTGAAVLDGVNGLRVDGTSVESVAQAISRFLTSAAASETFGTAGYRRALSEFSWERVADQTLRCIKERLEAC